MKTFLPVIFGESLAVEGEGALNTTEQALCALIEAHPEQGRSAMHLHPLLTQVARAHCLDMAARRYQSHTNPEGYGPNHRVTAAGYRLPEWYAHDSDSNNVESLQWGGDGDLDADFPAWIGSPKHRTHILGLVGFYAQQTNYGIAFVKDMGSVMHCYYCFLSAPPMEKKL